MFTPVVSGQLSQAASMWCMLTACMQKELVVRATIRKCDSEHQENERLTYPLHRLLAHATGLSCVAMTDRLLAAGAEKPQHPAGTGLHCQDCRCGDCTRAHRIAHVHRHLYRFPAPLADSTHSKGSMSAMLHGTMPSPLNGGQDQFP